MVTCWFMCGLPASGKSTWAHNNKDFLNANIHSSDAIREEFGNVNDQSKNSLVFELLHSRVKKDLLDGKSVIYDSTGLDRKKRIAFVQSLEKIQCKKVLVLFATPYETCLKNNESRDRKVPEDVIKRMYKSFHAPWCSEGWDDIKIIWWNNGNFEKEYDILRDMLYWSTISHDNKNHTLTIGDHMLKAWKYVNENFSNNEDDNYNLSVLLNSALLHDCGKPFVKDFVNSKGEITNTAHFYSHENPSAYLSLFYMKKYFGNNNDSKILHISLLINLHMRPFLAWKESDKAKEKDRKLYVDEIIKQIELLHEADRAAH